MRTNVFYGGLLFLNFILVMVLMTAGLEGWAQKGVQVLIVIVTFILFRTYMNDRNLKQDKKGDNE